LRELLDVDDSKLTDDEDEDVDETEEVDEFKTFSFVLLVD
jgi:hypothetical protein